MKITKSGHKKLRKKKKKNKRKINKERLQLYGLVKRQQKNL